ncbi:hypothetical protein EON80_10625 [bacterium]|nr:MAG: hypothetical protein EON80_10625 [bacterium]
MGAELWQFLLFGWAVFFYNYLFGSARHAADKVDLAKKKGEILPQFPNSQICPKCFHVTKKK